jgi:anti-sigma regulatory factor (Ser/Thr protein kinase)
MLVVMHVRLCGRHPFLSRDFHLAPSSEDNLTIDARRLVFAGPLELAGVVAMAHAAAADGCGTIFRTAEDPNVTGYLQRMDVIRRMPPDAVIDGRLPAERRTHLPAALLEVTPLAAGTGDDLATRLGRIASANFGSKTYAKVFAGIGELIDNAIDHGASQEGAFVAAQVYSGATSGRRGLEVAICDTGVGVLAHLRRNPAHADIPDSAEALKRAFTPGVSGTSEERGNGLGDLLSSLEFGGLARVHLRSGDGLATVTVGRRQRIERSHRTATSIEGTWAWLRIRIP